MEAEIWSLLSSTYRHGNTDRPTFTWVWIIATVFFSFLLLVRFKKSLSFVLWNAVKRKRVIQQKCSLCATDSRRLLRMKRFHSDQSHHHQFSGFCLRRLQSATQNCVWSSYWFPRQIFESANYYWRNCEWCNGLFLLRSWKKLKRTRARAEGAVAFDRLYANAKCQMPDDCVNTGSPSSKYFELGLPVVSITKFLNLFGSQQPLFVGWYRTRADHFDLSD